MIKLRNLAAILFPYHSAEVSWLSAMERHIRESGSVRYHKILCIACIRCLRHMHVSSCNLHLVGSQDLFTNVLSASGRSEAHCQTYRAWNLRQSPFLLMTALSLVWVRGIMMLRPDDSFFLVPICLVCFPVDFQWMKVWHSRFKRSSPTQISWQFFPGRHRRFSRNLISILSRYLPDDFHKSAQPSCR